MYQQKVNIILVMGVCGCGKTSIGTAIANVLAYTFLEADEFHSESNKEKMRGGVPLSDEDRSPWLKTLRLKLIELARDGISTVIACSALKEKYRDLLLKSIPNSSIAVVHLSGSQQLLQERLVNRQDHYMNPVLLQSQLAALEPPGTDNDPERLVLTIDLAEPVTTIVAKVLVDLRVARFLETE